MNTLPGTGYVLERPEPDGMSSVLPLPAWEVSDEGELFPLPRSFRAEWLARPAREGDNRNINQTSMKMSKSFGQVQGVFGPVKSPGQVEDAS